MDDTLESPPEQPGSNSPEMSVSELANALKQTVEENYAFVRVRGELGRVILAKSGHMYFDIKDEGATLNTIMWKGNASRLPFKPEEGLEVVAEGRPRPLPINGAGAAGAVLVDLGIPPTSARGFVLIARTAGLVAQLAEESRHPIGRKVWLVLEERARP